MFSLLSFYAADIKIVTARSYIKQKALTYNVEGMLCTHFALKVGVIMDRQISESQAQLLKLQVDQYKKEMEIMRNENNEYLKLIHSLKRVLEGEGGQGEDQGDKYAYGKADIENIMREINEIKVKLNALDNKLMMGSKERAEESLETAKPVQLREYDIGLPRNRGIKVAQITPYHENGEKAMAGEKRKESNKEEDEKKYNYLPRSFFKWKE